MISWFSIVLTIGTGIAGIVIFITSSSPAMLGYGLESFVDVFSSIVVVWRFSLDLKDCDNDGIEGSKQAMVYAAEKKAGMLIAFTFVAIGIVVSTEAVLHLADETKPDDDVWLIIFTACSFVVFFLLGLGKWYISKKVNSSSLKKDAVCSIAVSFMSLGMAGGFLIYRTNSDIWYLDSIVALIVSLMLIVYGSRTIMCHGHAWWSGSFWATSDKHHKMNESDESSNDTRH